MRQAAIRTPRSIGYMGSWTKPLARRMRIRRSFYFLI